MKKHAAGIEWPAAFSGVNILNSTVSGAGNIVFANGSTVTSTGDGSDGNSRGCIDLSKQTTTRNIPSSTINNIVITGYSNTAGALHVNGSNEVLFIGCTISNNVNTSPGGVGGALQVADSTYFPKVTLKDCLVTGNTAVQYGALATRYGASLIVDHCEITNNLGRSNGGPLGAVGGSSNHPDHIDIVNCYIHGNTCSNSYGQSIYVGGWADISITGTTMDCSLGIAPTMVDANSVIVISFKGDNVWTSDAPSLIKTYLRLADNANITGVTKIHSLSNVIYAEYGISVGSYNADATVYAVGGTASVTVNGHSLSLSGIGTYINSDGTNDFSTPYMVVNTSSSGSGSLLNGINDTTSTYVVIDHSVTDTSAVVNGDITGKEKRFTCGDGRTIVGGTFSLVEGTTVSAHCDVDEHGAHVVSGSTIAILGHTTNLAGNINLGGTLLLDNDCTLANGSTVTGVAGAKLDSTIPTVIRFTEQNSTCSISGITCGQITMGVIKGLSLNFSNVVFVKGQTAHYLMGGGYSAFTKCTIGDGISCNGTNIASFTDCSITGTDIWATGGNSTMKYKNTYINKVAIRSWRNNNHIFLTGTTVTGTIQIVGGTYDGQTTIFDSHGDRGIVFTGCIRKYQSSVAPTPNDTEVTYIVAGTTISLLNNVNATPIIGCAESNSVRVGTFSDDYKTDTWTTGGTATIITATGTTVKVSGEGTYINKDGTTDLTVIS